MRCWFSGRIPAFQAGDKSSILLRRTENRVLKNTKYKARIRCALYFSLTTFILYFYSIFLLFTFIYNNVSIFLCWCLPVKLFKKGNLK